MNMESATMVHLDGTNDVPMWGLANTIATNGIANTKYTE